MLGTIVLLLVIGAVLYLLWVNDKLNANSLTDSSEQSTTSTNESLNLRDDKANLRLGGHPKTRNMRVAHGENNISKVTVTETPLDYAGIIESGNKAVANTVFLGILQNGLDSANEAMSARQTSNFNVRQFKNMFIVFKGVDFNEIDNNSSMVRYESNKMVYALVDASNSVLPDLLRDVSYPIVVLVNNSSAQLVMKEWGYTQVNDSATLFVKNEKSFRLT
ncbi:odv-e25 [Spodoptera frugiperda granulovirus]|uniref:Odv-e25 n=1 Tax=Spodoptera frugiperda granulovirus TaxID=307454 RepID=A0A0C5AQ82_9BBAC|nr:odv-e25 [Spodoptera frugiperda granulovirus]AJK91746.1 odv-e25 [Spodoptera frugiperda granulovirus]AXS01108.1 odv-e25 [Spodoptera frugiperda granulovirus]